MFRGQGEYGAEPICVLGDPRWDTASRATSRGNKVLVRAHCDNGALQGYLCFLLAIVVSWRCRTLRTSRQKIIHDDR